MYWTRVPRSHTLLPHEELNGAITTRIFASKLSKKVDYDNLSEQDRSLSAIYGTRSFNPAKSNNFSSRFLLGAAIPNSVIRSESEGITGEQDESSRDERTTSLSLQNRKLSQKRKIQVGMDPKESERESIYNKETLSTLKSLLETVSEEFSSHKEFDSLTKSAENIKWEDSLEIQKARRRISCRTSRLNPFQNGKCSTFELVKSAIEKSKEKQEILNITSIGNDWENKIVEDVVDTDVTPSITLFRTRKQPPPPVSIPAVIQIMPPKTSNSVKSKSAKRQMKNVNAIEGSGFWAKEVNLEEPTKRHSTQTQTYLKMDDIIYYK